MCSLRVASGVHGCGATLISPRLAITAAYCVDPFVSKEEPTLWCGLYRQYSQGDYDVLRTVRAVRYPGYQPATYCNDLALLELDQAAMVGEAVGGIQPKGGTWPNDSLPEGFLLPAVGRGYTGEAPDAGQLPGRPDAVRFATLPFIPLHSCNAEESYGGKVLP